MTKEAKEICKMIHLPDITKQRSLDSSKKEWKGRIKEAIKEKNEKDLREKIEKSSKVNGFKEEDYEMKNYLKEMKMSDARVHFRVRTRMIRCKMNQPSDPINKATLWQCTGCGNVDTQSHILYCPAYQELREGKSLSSDEDIVHYFRKVMSIREELQL